MSALVLAAILAGGAPTTSMPTQPTAPQTALQAAKPRPEALSIWRPDADGGAEHLQSGLRCPQQVGRFARAGFTGFDGFGFDVSCGYDAEATTLTVYLTRTAQIDEAYNMAKAAVPRAQASRSPRLVADGVVEADGLRWRRAVYAFDRDEQSDVWMTDLHGWALKYRVTYRAADETAVRASLAAITGQIRQTAGVRLASCAKPAPARPGKRLPTKGLGANPTMLAALLSGAAASENGDKASVAAPPPVYCPEEAFATDGKGFLLWRTVEADGDDLKADRLTAMTMGPPPTLDIALDEVGNTITAELTGKKQSRWVATMRTQDATEVYGYFDRRPSGQAVMPLLLEILAGKAAPLGAYDHKTRSIQLNMSGSR